MKRKAILCLVLIGLTSFNFIGCTSSNKDITPKNEQQENISTESSKTDNNTSDTKLTETTTNKGNNTSSNSDAKNANSNTNKSKDKNSTETKVNTNATTNKTASSSTASKDTNITVDNDSNSTNNNASSQNNTKETRSDEKSFYGNWQITRVVRHSRIVALPDESKFIGQIMNFSNNEAKFVDIDIKIDNDQTKIIPIYFPNPKYTITNKTKKEFIRECRCDPSELGIDSDTITFFTAETTSKKPKTSPSIIVKDNDTLIYINQGVDFELKRVV
ncbi:hypothetical protein [Clostridium taeniosporum]|uniref:Lipoprotein n=1 Tax=Clostridium taeniosporum TaxID=394958 RepID=A0A1D7XPE5_9CLOT|nr:hypothetical protein [Clostridium taeniosporum]AOR25039.1 hypothetical protein BGI42_14935 [Clostridium taeniosporum]